MKSCKWIILLILAGNLTSISLCRAQEFMYRSTVRDSVTQKGLPDVYIFAGTDSIGGVRSKVDGTFLLNVRKGETVRFRKKGYKWLNVEIRDTNATPVEMVQSAAGSNLYGEFDEVEVNGVLLPKEELNDLNPDYITEVSVSEIKNKKYRLIIKTK
jgi:hypothetical protein